MAKWGKQGYRIKNIFILVWIMIKSFPIYTYVVYNIYMIYVIIYEYVCVSIYLTIPTHICKYIYTDNICKH